MIEHRCSVGERGGFFQRLDRGTYPAHILEHITIELQMLEAVVQDVHGRAELVLGQAARQVAVRGHEHGRARQRSRRRPETM